MWKLEDISRRPKNLPNMTSSTGFFLTKDLRKLNIKETRYRKYGITGKEVEDIFIKQDSRCGICRKKLHLNTRDCHIDHDHKTNKVRGILCMKCNLGLGSFRDNPKFLKLAISYLTLTK
jgi:hypothetical protein